MIHVIISSSRSFDCFPCSCNNFCRTFIIKGNANNGRNPNLGPFLDIAFINEEETGCINGETIGPANEAAVSHHSIKNFTSFFISCFTVLVVPSIYRPDFSSDFTILIISSISSFQLNKMNPFPALTALRPLIFISNFISIFLLQIYLLSYVFVSLTLASL